MRYPNGRGDEAQARREAASWAAKMHGPDAERARLDFERWRAASPQHRVIYAEMEAISRGTRQLGAAAIGRDYRGLPVRGPLFARPAFRLAAAAILALVIAAGSLLLLYRPGAVATRVGGQPVIASTERQLRRLRLPDGSSVVLDADTRIEVAFGKASRLVRLLRGRARFDVAATAGAPFMVAAGDRMILDRGTVFDVAVDREGVKISLLRGAVEIRARAGTDRPGRILARLVPGQLALAMTGSMDIPVRTAALGADRWVDGELSYDGARLADVIADIDRYATRRVRLADPALGTMRVTGVFRAVPAEGAAHALATALGLHVDTAGNGDLILRR